MMHRLAPLLLAGLVLAACGSAATEVASGPTEAPTTDSTTTSAPAAPAEPVDGTTTTTAAPLPTGREALAAAQAEGRPVVLWFWGAH